jgi:sialate O-acetylesterase
MLGEVWLMSGQSNMEMSAAWGIKDGDEMAKPIIKYQIFYR